MDDPRDPNPGKQIKDLPDGTKVNFTFIWVNTNKSSQKMETIKNVLAILLLLGCFTGTLGQNSAGLIKPLKFSSKDLMVKIDGSEVGKNYGCEMGKENAKRLISSQTIYFPMNVNSTLTLRKLLEIEYGIMDEGYDPGTCLRSDGEAPCFYEVMQDEIERRWGKNFLALKQRLANELDKQGKGYVEPRENDIQDRLYTFIKTKAHDRDDKMGYSIKLKISPEKRILDLEILGGGLFAERPIERNSKDYMFIKGALDNIGITCEPGRLHGKPVASLIYLHAFF